MTRVASAAVLVALLFVTIWWLPAWVTLLAVAVAAQAAAEIGGLATAAGAPVPRGMLAAGAAAVAFAFAIHDGSGATGADALVPLVLAVVVGAGLVALASGPPSPAAFTRASTMVMAPLYVGLPVGALAWIARAAGPSALTWLLVVIAASDSAQYYTGRAFGRRKLAPVVSPGKTVEGAIGGIVIAAIVAAVAGHWWLPRLSPVTLAILGVLLAGFGMAGDLFESMLKRSAGVKDSSNLIPGHGGVLDRIDSYLFAAPVFYVFLRYLA
jgi:phosphatidate cytidylyltransferase